jgi:hypothetical protein
LFVWFLDPKNKKGRRLAAIGVFVLGLVSSFLIGFNNGSDAGTPWVWDGDGAVQEDIGPYFDGNALAIPFVVFTVLAVVLWVYDIFLSRSNAKKVQSKQQEVETV